MKKSISLAALSLFLLPQAFAEDLGKFNKLQDDVDTFIEQFQTDQANVKNAKTEFDASQTAVNALEDQLRDSKKTRGDLKTSRRKLDPADRVGKDDIKDLVSANADMDTLRVKLSDAKLKLDAAHVKFDQSAQKTKNADEMFFRKIQTFKAREKKLQAFVDSKNKAVTSEKKSVKETEEPETLKGLLSQSPKEFLKVLKGEKSDSFAVSGTTAPIAVAATGVLTSTIASGAAPVAAVANTSGSAASAVSAPAAIPLSKCDQAKFDLTALILKDKANSQILSNMVNLAALKMAYHMTGDKTHLLSLENYSQKSVTGLKSEEFKTKLSEFYAAQGEAVDAGKINRIFTESKLAYQSDLRLDNGSSSAILLYFSETPVADKKFPFSREDAAAVWAQSQIFVAKNYEIGRKKSEDGENQNRLNFSTQVYRLLNTDAGATDAGKKIATRDPAQLAARIESQQAQIRTAIETSIKTMKQEQIGCFQDQEAANCKPEDLKLGAQKMSVIQRNLAAAVSKGVLDSSKSTSTSVVKIDLLQSTAKDGFIDLKLAP